MKAEQYQKWLQDLGENDWGPWPTRILWAIFTGALVLIALNWDKFKPILFGF